MSIGKAEWESQRRVIDLFTNELDYNYLGDWSERKGNSNIEEGLLTAYLTGKAGYSQAQVNAAIHRLRTEAE